MTLIIKTLFHAAGVCCVLQIGNADGFLPALGWLWTGVTLAAVTPTWW